MYVSIYIALYIYIFFFYQSIWTRTLMGVCQELVLDEIRFDNSFLPKKGKSNKQSCYYIEHFPLSTSKNVLLLYHLTFF